MKTFLSLCFLFTSILSFSQSNSQVIQSSEDEFYYTGIESPQHDYILYVVKGNYSSNDRSRILYRDILLKMNHQGDIYDSIVFTDPVDEKFKIWGLIKRENEFIAWGPMYSPDNLSYPTSLRLIRLDYSFQILHDTAIYYPGYYLFSGKLILNSDNNIVMPNIRTTEDYASIYWYCNIISIDGTPVKEKKYETPQAYQGVIEIPQDHSYNLVDINKIVEIDSNLNCIQQLYLVPSQLGDSTLFDLMTTKLLDNNSYIIEGSTMELGLTKQGAWGVFKNGQWDKVLSFGSPDTTDYCSGLDFVNKNYIFSTLNHILPYSMEFDQQDNQMQLYCTSVENDVNWSLRQGGLGYIRSGTPIATSDTGCIWIGNYWDWHHKTNLDYDIIIFRLDANGSLLTQTNHQIYTQQIDVITTISNSILEIQDSKNDLCVIWNMLGEKVMQTYLSAGINKIRLDNQPNGIYLFQILRKNHQISSGKWFKYENQ